MFLSIHMSAQRQEQGGDCGQQYFLRIGQAVSNAILFGVQQRNR